jgi:hypothetical protein
MSDNTQRLTVARAAYDAVPLYDPKRAPVDLDLTDNTNLWGMPPEAERTWREALQKSPGNRHLQDALDRHLGRGT